MASLSRPDRPDERSNQALESGNIRSVAAGLLIMSRAAASVAELLRQESIKIDIRREGLTKLSIRPVRDVPAPQVELKPGNWCSSAVFRTIASSTGPVC
jgi:hypothetical protein